MRIGQLAKQSGFSQSSIRFYEQKGLIAPVERTHAGYRLYGEQALNRLTQIKLCKQLGFSLDDITQLIGEQEALDHKAILHTLAQRKLEVETLISELQINHKNISVLEKRLNQLWQQDKCMGAEELAQLVKSTTF